MRLFKHVEQGSQEWLDLRAQFITASTFGDAVSKVGCLDEKQAKYVAAIRAGNSEEQAMLAAGYKAKPKADSVTRALQGLPVGEPSEASEKLAVTKAIEFISGKPYGKGFTSYETDRGHEEESFGRMAYEGRFGVMVDQVGLIAHDTAPFSYSPDGIVKPGLLEFKAPSNPLKLVNVVVHGIIDEYVHQMQGGMWLANGEWVDLCVPAPELACLDNGNELYVRRVWRDDAFISQMEVDLWTFYARVQHYEAILRKPFSSAAEEALAKLAA
jgi:hypothetical protein